jgi:hypothetical protein
MQDLIKQNDNEGAINIANQYKGDSPYVPFNRACAIVNLGNKEKNVNTKIKYYENALITLTDLKKINLKNYCDKNKGNDLQQLKQAIVNLEQKASDAILTLKSQEISLVTVDREYYSDLTQSSYQSLNEYCIHSTHNLIKHTLDNKKQNPQEKGYNEFKSDLMEDISNKLDLAEVTDVEAPQSHLIGTHNDL